MFLSVQLSGSGPGGRNGSMNRRSHWMPSRLVMKTPSDAPFGIGSSWNCLSGTKRRGNIM